MQTTIVPPSTDSTMETPVQSTVAEDVSAMIPAPRTPEIVFEDGLIGFPDSHRFLLVQVDEGSADVFELRSLDEPGLGFVTVAPGSFFPDYAPELDDATADRLGLNRADDALLLAVVTLGDTGADATANLLAPVVVNQHTAHACQAVLSEQGWPLRAPLSAA
jgi:flagellar assembly factor FliW